MLQILMPIFNHFSLIMITRKKRVVERFKDTKGQCRGFEKWTFIKLYIYICVCICIYLSIVMRIDDSIVLKETIDHKPPKENKA